MSDDDRTAWRYAIPQALTGLRVVLAVGAILSALARHTLAGAKFIPLCTVTDILDGPIAVTLHATSDFGALFDYFADYLCYIVAPVVLSCSLFMRDSPTLATILLSVPLLTGAIRYSRNAGLLKKESFDQVGFPGMLTSCYALFIVGVILVDLPSIVGLPRLKTVLCIAIPIMAVLMISRIRYPKLTVSKAVGALVVAFLLAVPFVRTRMMAAFMLCLVLAYTLISPALVPRARD